MNLQSKVNMSFILHTTRISVFCSFFPKTCSKKWSKSNMSPKLLPKTMSTLPANNKIPCTTMTMEKKINMAMQKHIFFTFFILTCRVKLTCLYCTVSTVKNWNKKHCQDCCILFILPPKNRNKKRSKSHMYFKMVQIKTPTHPSKKQALTMLCLRST